MSRAPRLRELSTVLQQLQALEQTMGGAYRQLARVHADNKQLSQLWLKTAGEEDNHAAQFGILLGARGEIAQGLALDSERVSKELAKARRFLQLVSASPPPEQALREAIQLENDMRTLHADLAVVFASASHQKLFRAMMAADRGHVESLKAALSGLERR